MQLRRSQPAWISPSNLRSRTGEVLGHSDWHVIEQADANAFGAATRLAKMNNTLKARQVIADARDLLGGNGILLENHVIRHMTDIESIYTYEGTEHIQTLIVGRDITGVSAFA